MNRTCRQLMTTLLAGVFGIGISLAAASMFAAEPAAVSEPAGYAPKSEWRPLFDGKSLDGWKITEFGGHGEVYVEEGQLFLTMGADLTGVTWTDADTLPKINYEIALEAKKIDGNDFFCGITFPVNDKPCSLILGGWGGATCGLSSLDGLDAARNETRKAIGFKKDTWYHVRLRVTDDKITVWLDDKVIIDQVITDRELSIRREVDKSRPLGLATFMTTATMRDIKVRELAPDEVAAEVAPVKQ